MQRVDDTKSLPPPAAAEYYYYCYHHHYYYYDDYYYDYQSAVPSSLLEDNFRSPPLLGTLYNLQGDEKRELAKTQKRREREGSRKEKKWAGIKGEGMDKASKKALAFFFWVILGGHIMC